MENLRYLFRVVFLIALPFLSAAGERCTDAREPGMTWDQFCDQVLNRHCLDVDPSRQPSCGDCRTGYKDIGATTCAVQLCQDTSETGHKWSDLCAALADRVCVTSGQTGPKCVCRPGFREDGAGNCTETSCSDDSGQPAGVTWSGLCGRRRRLCLKAPNEDPKCGGCAPGFKEDGAGKCTGQSCDDLLEWSMTWTEFCLRFEDRQCAQTDNGGPECACRQGFVEGPDGRCSSPAGFTTPASEGLCPTLVEPANGTMVGLCGPAVSGSKCLFQCHRGFRLLGSPVLRCQEGGFWHAPTPTCAEDDHWCRDLQAPWNGSVTGQCRNSLPRDVCVFSCDRGHQLEGSAVLVCGQDRTWDAQEPLCTATLKCSDVVEGTKDTWKTLCARGSNMVCLEHPSQGPECVCRDGYKRNDLGACVVKTCDDVAEGQPELEVDRPATWTALCQKSGSKACFVDSQTGPKCV